MALQGIVSQFRLSPWYLRSSTTWPPFKCPSSQITVMSWLWPPTPPTVHCPPPTAHSSYMQLQSFPRQARHWHTSTSSCPNSRFLCLANLTSLDSPVSLYPKLITSLLNLCVFLVCETRTVCTTTPAQKSDSICTLVIGKTLSLFHCRFHRVPDSPTFYMFGGFNQYSGLLDGRVDGKELEETWAQASIGNTPSLPIPPPPPQPRFWA